MAIEASAFFAGSASAFGHIWDGGTGWPLSSDANRPNLQIVDSG
jgi:hypothetical protein